MTLEVLPVSVRLHPTSSRGRASGYRGVCTIAGIEFPDGANYIGFEMQVDDPDRIEPGETRQCQLKFWAGDMLRDVIPPGTKIRRFDGHSEVAVGHVLEDPTHVDNVSGPRR